MPKYRPLSSQELQEFEKEFIEFLSANTVTADDWVTLKAENPEKAEQLIDLFSDVIMESVLQKIQFLELRSKNELMAFQCLEDKILLAGMRSNDPASDFTNPDFIQQGLQQPPADLKIFTSEKPYDKPRERELFEMTQAGCLVTDGKVFKALSLAIAGSKDGEFK